MPYRLRKSRGKDLYWVIGEDGTKHSKLPLPKARAEAQMKALYVAMRKEGGSHCLEGGLIDMELGEILKNVGEVIKWGYEHNYLDEKTVKWVYKVAEKLNLGAINTWDDVPKVVIPLWTRGNNDVSDSDIAKLESYITESSLSNLISSKNYEKDTFVKDIREPTKDEYILMCDDSYLVGDKVRRNIGKWYIIWNSPTIKIYTDEPDYEEPDYEEANPAFCIATRGTLPEEGDIVADFDHIVDNDLHNSSRYKEDLNQLNLFKKKYGDFGTGYVYGCGHSLGGALLDRLITDGIVKKGFSLNPAYEPMNIKKKLPNYRMYNRKDGLYRIMGWMLTVLNPSPPQVIPWDKMKNEITLAFKAVDTVKPYLPYLEAIASFFGIPFARTIIRKASDFYDKYLVPFSEEDMKLIEYGILSGLAHTDKGNFVGKGNYGYGKRSENATPSHPHHFDFEAYW